MQSYIIGWMNAVHAEPITVDSFNVLVMRDTSIIISRKNKGAAFAKELKQLFDDLKVGDKVLAYDIYATMTKQKILINPLEYLIE